VSATAAARGNRFTDGPAHDSVHITVCVQDRLEPGLATLWAEVQKSLIDPTGGVLVIDDSNARQPRAKPSNLVGYHWSGYPPRGRLGSI